MKSTIKFGLVALFALMAVAAIAGHPLVGPDMFALAFGLGFVGDTIDTQTLSDLIEKQGKAWEAERKALDERLDAIAKGQSTSDLDAKLKKIGDEMTEVRKLAVEAERKAGRPNLGGDHQDKSDDEIAYSKAFERMLRTGKDSGLAELQQKAMNSTSDPDGGYLVLPELDRQIDRVVGTISAMNRLASTATIGTNQWQKVMKTSGMAMRRIADGSAGGETTEPQYAKVLIDVHTAEVEPWVYNETLEDATINLSADLAEEAAIGFAEGAGAEFITGNGVGKARGITAYTNVANASYTWGKVGYIVSGKSAAFASVAPADKLINLQHGLKAQYRPGAVWMTNDTTLGVMRQMKDGSGSFYLWQPDPTGSFGGRFLGSPVEIDDNFAALAANSYSLAYGNMARAYKIVNRAGTTLIRDNITTKGNTKFNFRRRFGGGIYNFEAIKLMKFATS